MVLLKDRVYGEAGSPPLVVLHGLLGSSRNWQTAAGALAERFRVRCLDLRNHGESPHAAPHSYETMAEDVIGWLDANGLERARLMGHSMGGKLAMKLACEHPDRIEKLVVVDITPRRYAPTHTGEFEAMREVAELAPTSRGEAEKVLGKAVSDWGLRQFLLTNLIRNPDTGRLGWQIGLEEIEASQREIEGSPIGENQSFGGETLFVYGGRSNYFHPADRNVVGRHFPNARIEVMADCGHNPHFEKREAFVGMVWEFFG